MKRIVLWGVLAASIAANVATLVVALSRRAAAPPGEPRLFSMVELDPDQRARITRLRAALLATREERARRLSVLRGELAASIVREPADAAAVENALRSISEVQSGYQRAVVEHVLAVRDLLRPEQRSAFERMVAEHVRGGGPLQLGGSPSD